MNEVSTKPRAYTIKIFIKPEHLAYSGLLSRKGFTHLDSGQADK
jgi:hypothetical protein